MGYLRKNFYYKYIVNSKHKCNFHLNHAAKTFVNSLKNTTYLAIYDTSIVDIESYSRPFSGCSKRYHSAVDLKQEFKKTFTQDESKIHECILNMRNSVIGHSDEKTAQKI